MVVQGIKRLSALRLWSLKACAAPWPWIGFQTSLKYFVELPKAQCWTVGYSLGRTTVSMRAQAFTGKFTAGLRRVKAARALLLDQRLPPPYQQCMIVRMFCYFS